MNLPGGPNDLWDYSRGERFRVYGIWKAQPYRVGLLFLVFRNFIASKRDWIISMMKTANKMKEIK